MVKDLSGAVHLAQDDDHLVVDELLELSEVTGHLHLQLCADLRGRATHSDASSRQPALTDSETATKLETKLNRKPKQEMDQSRLCPGHSGCLI